MNNYWLELDNSLNNSLSKTDSSNYFDPFYHSLSSNNKQGRFKEGIIELKKSLSLDPENITAQKYLEKVQKKYDEEQKMMYTKQAKQLNFDRQKLEMKNAAALNFNA